MGYDLTAVDYDDLLRYLSDQMNVMFNEDHELLLLTILLDQLKNVHRYFWMYSSYWFV
ncbi:hypothetical protein D3C83_218820 [compost metagenome]